MADNVIITPSASYTVAAEDIGASVEVQRVKIVLGTVDVDGGNVGLTNPMPVTGTVSVPAGLSVSAQVSGAVSVSAMPAVSISVSAVLGTVVTVLGTQVVSVVPGVSVNALVTGPVSISAMPAVSISVSAVLGTVVTVLGTVAVNVVAGGAAPGTTAATQSAISAQVVWLAPTQTMTATVNTIAAGFSVQALVTGPVSISAMPAISISVSAALGTVITILGTQIVSVVPGVSVNALVTGPVSISAMPAVSISVSAILGTVVTVLGTVLVSVVPQVTIVVSGYSVTTATPSVSASGAVVWLANTVTVTVTATVTGSLIISGIAVVTTQASVSVSGLPVWLNPTQGVTILGTQLVSVVPGVSVLASLSSAPNVVAGLASGATGIPVWPGTPAYSPVVIYITSTAIAQSAAVYLMTVWTGGIVAAAGTTAYPVPAGKNLRIRNIQFAINSSAVTGGTVVVMAVGATATASHVSGSVATQPHIAMLQILVSAGVIAGSIDGGQGDLIAATTLAIVIQASTAAQAVGGIIQGYLF